MSKYIFFVLTVCYLIEKYLCCESILKYDTLNLSFGSLVHLSTNNENNSDTTDIIIDTTLIYSLNYNFHPVILSTYDSLKSSSNLLTDSTILNAVYQRRHENNLFKSHITLEENSFENVISLVLNLQLTLLEVITWYVYIPNYAVNKFQESLLDLKEYSPIISKVVIFWKVPQENEEMIYEWTVLCYLCPLSVMLSTYKSQHLPLQIEITQIFEKKNWKNFYGNKGYFQYQPFSKVKPYEECKYDVSVVQDVSYVNECDYTHRLFGIIERILNISFEQGNVFGEEDLHAFQYCEDCSVSPENVPIYTQFNVDSTTFNFKYCRNKFDVEEPSWDFLVLPFDVYVWLSIIMVISCIGLMYWDPIVLITTISVYLGQPILGTTTKLLKKIRLLQAILFLSSIFITNSYLCQVTTNVLVPLPWKNFDTVANASSLGFRNAIADWNWIEVMLLKYRKFVEDNCMKPTIKECFVVLDSFDTSPQLFELLADHKSISLFRKDSPGYKFFYKDLVEFSVVTNGKILQCNTIRKSFITSFQIQMFRLYGATMVRKVDQRLKEASIHHFWAYFKHYWAASKAVIGMENGKVYLKGHQVSKLSLRSPVIIIFYLAAILGLISIFVFCFECYFWNWEHPTTKVHSFQ